MTERQNTLEEVLTAAATIVIMGGLLWAVSKGDTRRTDCLTEIGTAYAKAEGGEFVGIARYETPPRYMYTKDGRTYTATFHEYEVAACRE